MMSLTAIAALAAGLVADGTARVEARGGTTNGGSDPNSLGFSADLLGRASNPDGVVRFGLSPSVVRAQGNQLFVRGFGEGDLRLRENAHVRLRQTLGYGSVDLSPVGVVSGVGAVQPPVGVSGVGAVQPPVGNRFVSVQESNTSLQADVATSRRLRLSGSASWIVTGGADAGARAAFPLRRGPLVRGSAEWAATHTDTLRLALEGFDYRYSSGQRATVGSLAAGWQTRLARDADLALSLGPGIGRTQTGAGSAFSRFYAVGSVDLHAAPVRDVSAGVGAGVEPLGDPLTGDLVERGSLRASLIWDRHRALALSVRLIGSMALTSGTGGPTSTQAGDRYLEGEAGATMPLDPHSSVTAGLRAAFLSRPLQNQPSAQWVAFVNYVAQVPLLR